jgi:hypothetical protein
VEVRDDGLTARTTATLFARFDRLILSSFSPGWHPTGVAGKGSDTGKPLSRKWRSTHGTMAAQM